MTLQGYGHFYIEKKLAWKMYVYHRLPTIEVLITRAGILISIPIMHDKTNATSFPRYLTSKISNL